MWEIIITIGYLVGSYALSELTELFSGSEFEDMYNSIQRIEDDWLKTEEVNSTVGMNRESETIMAYNRWSHYRTQKIYDINVEECNKYIDSEQGQVDKKLVDKYTKSLQEQNEE